MIVDANDFDRPSHFDADICILGGGVAGIVLANELLTENKSIILLESGDDGFDGETQFLYEAESTPKYFPDPTWSRLRMLGGASNHWENSIERFDPIDFQRRNWIEHSGWPITYDEVAKYYPEAEAYCRVAKEGCDFSLWREKLTREGMFSDSSMFESVIAKSPASPTLFFEEYGKALVDNKSIRVIKNANVVDVDYQTEQQNVQAAVFQTFSGVQHRVKAKAFVMCMGGIENARMLLHFNERYDNKLGNQYDNVGRYFMEHPTVRAAHFLPLDENGIDKIHREGIVVDNELTLRGRASLSEHAQSEHQTFNMRMYFNKKSKIVLSDGVSSSHVVRNSLKESEIPDEFGSHLLNIIKDIDHIAESFLQKEFDRTLFDSVHEFGGYQLLAMIEQTPHRDNRIKLGTTTDAIGLKKIKIDFHVTEQDKQRTWKTLELLSKDTAIQKLGRIKLLKERESRIWGSQLGYGQHHMGTTRMSDRAEEGVVDASSKVFGTNNLYVAGSSVFPTGGHVPPTLTIVAMAIKLANEIKHRT